MEDQEIDPDIMNMVAAMCGDYSGLPNKENEERSVSSYFTVIEVKFTVTNLFLQNQV